MSLFTRKVKALFSGGNQKSRNSEYDKLFLFLRNLINREDLVSQYFKDFESLKAKGGLEFSTETIPLYVAIEDFLVSSRPVVVKRQLGRVELHEEIKKIINIEAFDEKFRLLFYPQDEQMIYLYEIFSQDFALYIIGNLGFDKFNKMLSSVLTADIFETVSINQNGFDFQVFNSLITKDKSKYQLETVTSGFKNLYSIFLEEIQHYVGNRIAAGLFEKIYKTIQHLYGHDITARFIGVIPESALGISEWLSMLGREELEKHVLEKTKQLQELTDSLEKKVAERTGELKRTVERLEVLNREQDMSGKMLIRRDLELSQANERLLELDQKKSEFVTIAAHQLRTPLSGIKWILSMLIKKELGSLTDDQMSFIMKGYESNERMINLVDDMLNADRIDSGKYFYAMQPVQILDLFDNLLYEMVPIARKKNVSIEYSNRPAAIPRVLIDPDKTRAAIQNLLENSIKYTPAFGHVVISFKVVPNDFLEIAISDTGIGIPNDQKHNIFNRFFRGRNAVKIETDGSGLGLFIVKSIIEKHSGRVWFESEENKGTTFHFTLKIYN